MVPIYITLLYILFGLIVLSIIFYISGFKVKNDADSSLFVKNTSDNELFVKNTSDSELYIKENLDTPLLDAFGRNRMSIPFIIFDSKQHDKQDTLKWDTKNTGETIQATYTETRASTVYTTVANAASTYIKQTYRRFDYRAAKSQVIFLTGVICKSVPTNAPGLQIGYGQYDSNNGVFFQYKNNTMNVVVRNNGSDTVIPQSSWNIDKMDGNGTSGITADWSKIQIFVIDYGWLGADNVRFCLVINGIIRVVHKYRCSNELDGVYMASPNNPIRFEIITTADTPQIQTEQICCSVSSEGGSNIDDGIVESFRNTAFLVDSTKTQDYILLMFRLKSDRQMITIQFLNIEFIDTGSDADVEWKLIFDPTIVGTIPSWTDVSTNSSLQYIQQTGTVGGSTLYVSGGGTYTTGGYITSGIKRVSLGTNSVLTENQQRLGSDIDGNSQIIAITVKGISSGNPSVRCIATWKEF